jgi:hypothetical protein
MKRAIGWAAAAALVALTAACEPRPHTEDTMLSGSHIMSTPKTSIMSDRVMPSGSINCSPEALATMPPEHRQACLNAQRSR